MDSIEQERRYIKDDKVETLKCIFKDSVISEYYKIPESTSGGIYKIKIHSSNTGFAYSERSFEIRAFQNPRLNTQLEFVRKGYGPGEQASFTLNVKRVEGGIPENAKVTCTARIDGKEIWTEKTTLDKKGNCLCQFTLPKEIKEDSGTLTCVIQDGGTVETASNSIPVLLPESFDIDFYPEGGDLICDLECGLYFEGNNKNGEPADFTGDIFDDKNQLIISIATKHEGRGKTYFVPKPDRKYHLEITKPFGVQKQYPLPQPKKQGATISSLENICGVDENISFKLLSTFTGTFYATLFKRDMQISRTKIVYKKENLPLQFEFTTPSDSKSDGVLRILLQDDKKKPIAERLIFRKSEQVLKCQISTNYKNYCPGDKAKVTIFTSDQEGKPISSFVCLNVTDESVLEKVEKRKQPPRLPVMVYLEQEVDHLEDARIYLSNDEKADLAVDLLLGTQGWRRFVFEDIKKFLKDEKERAERVLGLNEEVFSIYLAPPPPPPPPISNPYSYQISYPLPPMFGGFSLPPPPGISGPPPPPGMPGTTSGPPPGMPGTTSVSGPPSIVPQPSIPQQQIETKKTETKIENVVTLQSRSGPLPPPINSKSGGPPLPPSRYTNISIPSRNTNISIPSFFKEYYHQKRKDRKDGDRQDFTETLYWNSVQKSNEKGIIEFYFDFSDSITSYHIMVDVFTSFGVISSFDKIIECKEPFYIEPILPLEVTSGDKLKIPLTLVNSSSEALSVKLTGSVTKGLSEPSFPSKSISLKGEERSRTIIEYNVSQYNAQTTFTFTGNAGAFQDTVTRKTNIVPLGFPASIYYSGIFNDKSTVLKFDIPENIVEKSLVSEIKIFPSFVSNLNSALSSLIKEPYGCFEQTSSTSYPLVMAHQYFIKNGADPSTISKSLQNIEKAYKKLEKFECRKGGYEWFGKGDGVELLTAYGIMQFCEMEKIINLDQSMLKRTIKWLLNRRDKYGDFKYNESKEYQISHGTVSKELKLAYILFALTEAKIDGLEKEVENLLSKVSKSKDPYILALASNVFFNIGKKKEGQEYGQKLAEFIESDGSINKAITSITRSYGFSLTIETTSLALLAWLNDYKQNEKYIHSSIKYIFSSCKSGNFGSTQATILALKAIMKYLSNTKKNNNTKATILINGEKVQIDIDTNSTEEIIIPCGEKLKVGKSNQIELSCNDGNFSFAYSSYFNTIKPESNKYCVFDLETKLSSTKFKEGSGGEINVCLKNLKEENQAMTIAVIGLPGGLEPRHEQLKELIEKGVISFYEIIGRNIVCYWRAIEENAEIKFKIDVVARVPGIYQGSASSAYLYYCNELKKWTDGMKCEIDPKCD